MKLVSKDIFALFGKIAASNQETKVYKKINHSLFIFGTLFMCTTLVKAGEIGSCTYKIVHQSPPSKAKFDKVLRTFISLPAAPELIVYSGNIQWELRLTEKSESNTYFHMVKPGHDIMYFKVKYGKGDAESMDTPVSMIKVLKTKNVTNSELGRTYPQIYLQSFVAKDTNRQIGAVASWNTISDINRQEVLSMIFTKIDPDDNGDEIMKVSLPYDPKDENLIVVSDGNGGHHSYLTRELRIWGECRIDYYTHNYNAVEHEGAVIRPFVTKHLKIIDDFNFKKINTAEKKDMQ